ncbi:hypothetical protein [Brucella haematophila]|uniref:hypothetical protein n=1 Tax=Brucella haematophila TaxID=419474 RepID=UPI00110E2781|nr:hypothetical protein [Brucella haematophila]TMV01264.1 hypothetical protein FGI60_16240 [Brucella haematophila]
MANTVSNDSASLNLVRAAMAPESMSTNLDANEEPFTGFLQLGPRRTNAGRTKVTGFPMRQSRFAASPLTDEARLNVTGGITNNFGGKKEQAIVFPGLEHLPGGRVSKEKYINKVLGQELRGNIIEKNGPGPLHIVANGFEKMKVRGIPAGQYYSNRFGRRVITYGDGGELIYNTHDVLMGRNVQFMERDIMKYSTGERTFNHAPASHHIYEVPDPPGRCRII